MFAETPPFAWEGPVMLTLCINPADLIQGWRWNGDRYVAGRSWLAPFTHPALEHHLYTGPERTTIVIRERRTGSPPTVITPEAWDGPIIMVSTTPSGRVAIQTGASVVVPLYTTVDGTGVIHASWDLNDLRGRTPSDRLNEVEVARLLALWLRYTPATFLDDVVRLTERATLTIEHSRFHLLFPDDGVHYTPREVQPDADVIAAFDQLLSEAIEHRVYDPDAVLVEVSGGADSAQVALSLTARHPGRLTAAGMLLPGLIGKQQAYRRDALITGRFAQDVTVAALPPMHPKGIRATRQTVSPYEEPYTEATTAMLHAAAAGRQATVWSGIGGDEMLALSSSERERLPIGHGRDVNGWLSNKTVALLETADEGLPPVSVVNEMTLLAFGYRAPMMLRANCWPMHLLADPALIRFGEWLPVQWRRGKRLARARLERAGFAPEVVYPAVSENFADLMRTAITRHVTPWLRLMLAQGGVLLDCGFIAPDGLTATLDRIETGGYVERDAELFDLLMVEQAAAAFR
ncbi:asparagine synthase-related protein [Streptosporangium amethystogenes]|uniref:asparagine synthase-related protein n=1 Tax=Streptosporangium amethystogenes TaxID=2002 RepID=UPI0012F74405|nr:asparagine synthase-related protein [Streptosporangium amethystogenes]